MTWTYDVQVENTPLCTTGGHTWQAAYRLVDFLAATASQFGLDAPGVRVLELGAGCGYLGITLARNLPSAALVVLTEQEDGGACDWLRHNVEVNRQRGLPLNALRVQPCDWLHYALKEEGKEGDAAQLQAPGSSNSSESMPSTAGGGPETPLYLQEIKWDFIIGSDLIYNHIGSQCLPQVLAALAHKATQIYYCHTKHRLDLLDMEFFSELAAAGCHCEEVMEPDANPPPASPPMEFPPAELFPEQRIAVYKISTLNI